MSLNESAISRPALADARLSQPMPDKLESQKKAEEQAKNLLFPKFSSFWLTQDYHTKLTPLGLSAPLPRLLRTCSSSLVVLLVFRKVIAVLEVLTSDVFRAFFLA